MMRIFGTTVAALSLAMATACAATLHAGPGQRYATPSQAIAAAHNGDTVMIAAGTYYDCAIVNQNDLTIEGVGPKSIMTDKPCAGKALLVINGNNDTVKNLTLQRARVADGNGGGIRAEGGNLTVDNVRFFNNQDGILSAPNAKATIRVLNSDFVHNGGCVNAGGCAHAIYVSPISELDVEHSRFYDTQTGHSIKSRALVTIVKDCTIEDGPDGTSSYQIDIPIGGSLIAEGNTLEKGPKSQNHANAIMIGEEGVSQPTRQIIVKNNKLINNTGYTTVFVHNISATPAQLSGNTFSGGKVIPLAGDGSVH
ncbi:MAG: hypothetical protein KGL52_02775 [Rhodospirillales bacterium]|jgi:hypothetical protein|nr:hypothetical protein [Rhodospirillales bacterium]